MGLQDETNKPAAKKRGFLSRFGEQPPGSTDPTPPGTSDGPSGKPTGDKAHGIGFHFPGRKRGESGKGAELGNIDRPGSSKGGKSDGVVR